jgi:hypothetical protein
LDPFGFVTKVISVYDNPPTTADPPVTVSPGALGLGVEKSVPEPVIDGLFIPTKENK